MLISLVLFRVQDSQTCVVLIIVLDVVQYNMPHQVQELWKVDVKHVDVVDFLYVAIEEETEVALFEFKGDGLCQDSVQEALQVNDFANLFYSVAAVDGAH